MDLFPWARVLASCLARASCRVLNSAMPPTTAAMTATNTTMPAEEEAEELGTGDAAAAMVASGASEARAVWLGFDPMTVVTAAAADDDVDEGAVVADVPRPPFGVVVELAACTMKDAPLIRESLRSSFTYVEPPLRLRQT